MLMHKEEIDSDEMGSVDLGLFTPLLIVSMTFALLVGWIK